MKNTEEKVVTMENTAVEEINEIPETEEQIEVEIKKAGLWDAFRALPWWKKALVLTGAATLVVVGGAVIFKTGKVHKAAKIAHEVEGKAIVDALETAAETVTETVVENAPEVAETVAETVAEVVTA